MGGASGLSGLRPQQACTLSQFQRKTAPIRNLQVPDRGRFYAYGKTAQSLFIPALAEAESPALSGQVLPASKQTCRQADILFGHLFPTEILHQALGGTGCRSGLKPIGVGQFSDDLRAGIPRPQTFQALVPLPLGQPPSIRSQQQRTMGEPGCGQPQQLGTDTAAVLWKKAGRPPALPQ